VDSRRPTTPVASLNARLNAEAFLYYPRLQALAKYVTTHLGKQLTLEKASKRVGLEKKYFSAFFRSKVGITWTEWLRRLRVLHATEQIQLREESIARIALVLAFATLEPSSEHSSVTLAYHQRCTRLSCVPHHDQRRLSHEPCRVLRAGDCFHVRTVELPRSQHSWSIGRTVGQPSRLTHTTPLG
jgi:AraC-like DNA-binding protein